MTIDFLPWDGGQIMVKLYPFAPAWGLPNASGFCLKLETYLRMAGLPYEIAPGADLRKAMQRMMEENLYWVLVYSRWDATVYGFLATILNMPIESPLKVAGNAMGNLVAYRDRMQEKYY
jgi:hypothetical protein